MGTLILIPLFLNMTGNFFNCLSHYLLLGKIINNSFAGFWFYLALGLATICLWAAFVVLIACLVVVLRVVNRFVVRLVVVFQLLFLVCSLLMSSHRKLLLMLGA